MTVFQKGLSLRTTTIVGIGDRTWDQLYLGGELYPGIATLGGPGLSRDLDKKKAKGQSKASLKDEGDELGGITIDLFLWHREQYELFKQLFPGISPRRPGGPKSPIAILHPLANDIGIDNIYIEKIPVFKHDKRNATLTVSMTAVEWVPQPKPVTKGAGSKGKNIEDDIKNGFNEGWDAFWDGLDEANEFVEEKVDEGGDAVRDFFNIPPDYPDIF